MSKRRIERRHITGGSNYAADGNETSPIIRTPPPRRQATPVRPETSLGFLPSKPKKIADTPFPWQDPVKCNTQSTLWSDTVGSTTIHPSSTPHPTIERREKRTEQAAVIPTHTAKLPGGFLPGGEPPARPATSLGFTDAPAPARPHFDDLLGVTRPAPAPPATEQDFADMRRAIYRQGISVSKALGPLSPGASMRAEDFRDAVTSMRLAVPAGTVDRVVARLDPAGSGAVAPAAFLDALNLKGAAAADGGSEYSPFLVERTYFGGAARVDGEPRGRRAFSGEEIKAAYQLKARISTAFDLKYSKASEMFRACDENFDGALTPEEFADKIGRLNIVATPGEIRSMMAVLQFPKCGVITYDDFVNHVKLPDKWGFCSAFNCYLPLGQSGEGPPPLDSTVLDATKWKRQGRRTPAQLMQEKREYLKNMVEERKEIWEHRPTPRMVIPGKIGDGHLDLFLLEAVRTKLKTMRQSTRELFRLMDPRREGKISRDNFHAWARREQLGVPPAAIDELIDYFDQDHAGYIEMQEFARVIDPDGNRLPPLPDHTEKERQEQERYLQGGTHPSDPPPLETHPEAARCARAGKASPALMELVQQAMERKAGSIRAVFRSWDTDRDGYVTVHELREGMARMNLGMPHSVAARLAAAADRDGNCKLDYNEFVRAFRPPRSTAEAAVAAVALRAEDAAAATAAVIAAGGTPTPGAGRRTRSGAGPDDGSGGSDGAGPGGPVSAGLVHSRSAIRSVEEARRTRAGGSQDGWAGAESLGPGASLDRRAAGHWQSEDCGGSGGGRWTDTMTSKGELLYYARTESPVETTVQAGIRWKALPREELRRSWQERTDARRLAVAGRPRDA